MPAMSKTKPVISIPLFTITPFIDLLLFLSLFIELQRSADMFRRLTFGRYNNLAIPISQSKSNKLKEGSTNIDDTKLLKILDMHNKTHL